MLQDFRKMGREYFMTGSIVETVTETRPTKDELINLKLDKVLHSAKTNFRHQPPKVGKCRKSLIEVLVVLISKGMELKSSEMTEIFFAATQLFQIKEWPVRRLIYVLLDILNPDADEAFIVTASLIKEVEKGQAAHRAKAIRRFTRVDTTIASQLETQIKNAILDENAMVSSSALCYGEFLFHVQPDIVRRWSTEVASSLKRNKGMAQAHAARLLFTIRKKDRLALMKQVKTLTTEKNTLSPVTILYTMQQAEKLIRKSDGADPEFESFIMQNLFMDQLHSSQCSVAFQAAKSIVGIATSDYHLAAKDIQLNGSIETLKNFLLHPCPVKRFGAIRTLHLLSQYIPESLVQHTEDIQEFHKMQVSHPTLSILAISTLLNAGNESNVDALLESIQSQGMNDMPDGFRLDIIRAIRSLSRKFPGKYPSFLNYLQSHTREDRTLQFKELLIQTIIDIAQEVPESYIRCLDLLCEFIEDCEYPVLTSYSIDKITEMICTLENPESYVRFIFNRLILESANVRAAALTSLTKLGRQFRSIRHPILKLVDLHSSDMDDTIRDMTVNCRCALTDDESTQAPSDEDIFDAGLIEDEEIDDLVSMYWGVDDVSPAVPAGVALDVGISTSNPVENGDLEEKEQSKAPSELLNYLNDLCNGQFRLKQISKKLPALKLTEDEAEYVVTAHVNFVEAENLEPNQVIMAVEVRIQNTYDNSVLTNVTLQFTNNVDGVCPIVSTEIAELKYGEEKISYLMMTVDRSVAFEMDDTLSCGLRYVFNISEDGTPSYEDEYDIEPLTVDAANFP